MKRINITLNDVFKKDLRIVGFLVCSWAVGLLAVYLTGNEKLLGLVPVTNYIAYRILEELKNSGYVEAMKNK